MSVAVAAARRWARVKRSRLVAFLASSVSSACIAG
jgi:hypothetical protein